MNRTESCYQKVPKTVTVHTPKVDGQPLRERVVMKTASGEEKTVSRRKYKKWDGIRQMRLTGEKRDGRDLYDHGRKDKL